MLSDEIYLLFSSDFFVVIKVVHYEEKFVETEKCEKV